MSYHLTPVRMVITKNSTNNNCWRRCEEKGTLLHCWWECKLVQPLWRTTWKIELPYDPAIQLLGAYPEKTINQKNVYTLMFTETPFTIARTWKQPKCSLSIDRGMDKEAYVCVCVCVCIYIYIENVICSVMSYLQPHGL